MQSVLLNISLEVISSISGISSHIRIILNFVRFVEVDNLIPLSYLDSGILRNDSSHAVALVLAGKRGSILQTSYLSQIISVEKNLSCGEISDFCRLFEQFMEFYQNLCRFFSKFVWRKSLWRKNDKYEVCYIVQYTLHPVQGYIFCHLKK